MKPNGRTFTALVGFLASAGALGCFSSSSAKQPTDGDSGSTSSGGGSASSGSGSSGGSSASSSSGSSSGSGGSRADGGAGSDSGGSSSSGSASDGGSASDCGSPGDGAVACSANFTITNVAFYGMSGGADSSSADAGSSQCPSVMPSSAAITAAPYSTAAANTIVYGTGSYSWTTYTSGSAGQAVPTLSLTQSDGALNIAAGVTPSADCSYVFTAGGLSFTGVTPETTCVNASAYDGITFTVTGDLGGCILSFVVSDPETQPPGSDSRSMCGAPACNPPYYYVTQTGTVTVPFAALMGGNPDAEIDPTTIIGIQWQLGLP